MKNTLPFLFLFTFFCANAQPNISIENVLVEKLPDHILSITYDLWYPTNDLAEVTFRATKAGGLVFDFNTSNATGDVGTGVGGGAALNIQWDYSSYADSIEEFRIMLVAKRFEDVDIQALVDQVDSTQLIGNMTFLEGIRHRTAGADHLADVQNFIENKFLDAELETNILTFENGNYLAKNIIGRKIGTSDEAEVYILDGHYDSVSDSPGADDNASAIAGMIEALRILSSYSFKKTIRFIGFDLEEAGLLGSFDYVANGIAPQENINGVLNFEMIGYFSNEPNSQDTPVGFSLLFPDAYAQLEADEFRGNFINLISNESAQPVVSAYEMAATTYVPDLKFLSIEAPIGWAIIAPDLGRSDHAPFWIGGMPAIMFTDGANFRNPYYHSPDDTSDKLNFTFMRQVVQATVASLAELAEIEYADTWWADTDNYTSVSEENNCGINLSPNPTRDFINVEWTNCTMNNLEVKLMDINGRIIHNYYEENKGINNYRINVRNFKKGIYFIQLKAGERKWTEKVVVH